MQWLIKLYKKIMDFIDFFLEKTNPDKDPTNEIPIEPPHIPNRVWKQGKKNVFTDADNITINGYKYKGSGNALTFKGECRNITIKNCSFEDVSKGVFIDRYNKGVVHGLTIEDSWAYNFSKSLLDCAPNSTDIVVYNCDINSNYNWSENFVMGIVIREDCKGITFNKLIMKNFVCPKWMLKEDKYANGDAISIESGCTDILMDTIYVKGSTDGGIDSKSGGIYRNLTLDLCKRPFRAWDTKNPYIFEGTNKFINCNKKDVYEWLTDKKPEVIKQYKEMQHVAGFWVRRDGVDIKGFETIEFINTSDKIRID